MRVMLNAPPSAMRAKFFGKREIFCDRPQQTLVASFIGRPLAFTTGALHYRISDASPFSVEPLGVALPADEDDVCALVRYAHEHNVIHRGPLRVCSHK